MTSTHDEPSAAPAAEPPATESPAADPAPPATEDRPSPRRHDATYTRLYTRVVLIRELICTIWADGSLP